MKNPYASGGGSQNGGKPATGLPGLAAFGRMQTYTPQTAQPAQPQTPEPAQQFAQPQEAEQQAKQQDGQQLGLADEPVAHAPQTDYAQPSAPEAAPYEDAYRETFAPQEQEYEQQQDFADAQPFQPEASYQPFDEPYQADETAEQDRTFVVQAQQQFAQADDGGASGAVGADAYSDAYSYAGDGDDAGMGGAEPHGDAGNGQSLNFSDLTDAYHGDADARQDDGAAHQFTADDLQDYVASSAQNAGDDHGPEEDEDFDLSRHMSLQPFEARYDQQRTVNLGGYDDAPGEQPFFHPEQRDDADFLGDEEAEEPMVPPRERKSRRVLMFASGLIGALALGGALAFAYKITGETRLADGSGPPLIKADDSPVKVAPDEPGGKQFAHQNKQIYDRLQGGQEPEVERIVPRQEAIEMPPPAAGSGTAVAAPNNGGPHKVRTLKVMPDGSVVVSAPPADQAMPVPDVPAQQAPAAQTIPLQSAQPSIPALPAPGSEMAGVAVTMPPQPQADQTTVASVPVAPDERQAASGASGQQLSSDTAPAPMPQPKPAAPARQTAAAQQTAAQGSGYAVQVASRRSQAMALAAFADLQQKYTSLLGNYQPLIQSADLGDRGVWYRLRVGPIGQKADADSLCNDLKRAGLKSCLVRPL